MQLISVFYREPGLHMRGRLSCREWLLFTVSSGAAVLSCDELNLKLCKTFKNGQSETYDPTQGRYAVLRSL